MTTQSPKVLLLDIEGTTTPISFVYDTLFPFAAAHLESFLRQNKNSPEVVKDIDLLQAQATRDLAEGLNSPQINAEDPKDRLEQAIRVVQWQMSNDRKTTGLKSLQGKIWKDGYASGELQGEVFSDVPDVLERAKRSGVKIQIYSSGSVAAQKLIFGHTPYGDLTTYLSGYYDTTTGGKKEQSSYQKIAELIGTSPASILFATDNLDEARAAQRAGMQVLVMTRPGNAALPSDHGFKMADDFSELFQ